MQRRVLPALAAMWGALLLSRTLSENDLFWHVMLGRDVLQHGSRTIPEPSAFSFGAPPQVVVPEWAWDVATWLGWSHGGALGLSVVVMLAGAFSAAAVAVLASSELGSRRAQWAPALTLVVLSIVVARFKERPETLALGLAAVFLWRARALLRSPSVSRLLMVVALEVVWAQVHGTFVLAPVFFVALAVGNAPRALTRLQVIALGVLGVGLFTSAAGLGLVSFITSHLGGDSVRHIIDMAAPTWDDFNPATLPYGFLAIVLTLVTLSSFVAHANAPAQALFIGASRWRAALAMLGVGLVVGLTATRGVAWWGLCLIPALALSAREFHVALRRRRLASRTVVRVLRSTQSSESSGVSVPAPRTPELADASSGGVVAPSSTELLERSGGSVPAPRSSELADASSGGVVAPSSSELLATSGPSALVSRFDGLPAPASKALADAGSPTASTMSKMAARLALALGLCVAAWVTVRLDARVGPFLSPGVRLTEQAADSVAALSALPAGATVWTSFLPGAAIGLGGEGRLRVTLDSRTPLHFGDEEYALYRDCRTNPACFRRAVEVLGVAAAVVERGDECATVARHDGFRAVSVNARYATFVRGESVRALATLDVCAPLYVTERSCGAEFELDAAQLRAAGAEFVEFLERARDVQCHRPVDLARLDVLVGGNPHWNSLAVVAGLLHLQQGDARGAVRLLTPPVLARFGPATKPLAQALALLEAAERASTLRSVLTTLDDASPAGFRALAAGTALELEDRETAAREGRRAAALGDRTMGPVLRTLLATSSSDAERTEWAAWLRVVEAAPTVSE